MSQQGKPLTQDYEHVKIEAEKPVAERQCFTDTHGQPHEIRNYHLSDKRLAEYWVKTQAIGAFVNPFLRGGPYKGQVQVLIDLGTNQWHSMAQVIHMAPKIMGTMRSKRHGNIWKAFVNRPTPDRSKNPNGKDLDGRLLQNFEVLQRLTGLHQYGYKLKQVCACVDVKFVPRGEDVNIYDGPVKDIKGTYYFRLNTTPNSPEDVVPLNNYKGKRRGRRKKQPIQPIQA
jgi:hypothetical protein